MAFINFGYATNLTKSSVSAIQSRNIGPPSNVNMMNYDTGSLVGSQISYLRIIGGNFDYLWGCHPWGSSKYKVTK